MRIRNNLVLRPFKLIPVFFLLFLAVGCVSAEFPFKIEPRLSPEESVEQRGIEKEVEQAEPVQSPPPPPQAPKQPVETAVEPVYVPPPEPVPAAEDMVAKSAPVDEKESIASVPDNETQKAEAPPPAPEPQPAPAPPAKPQKTDQELLDSALEFCQASGDFWEQGHLDEAIDALDQAYSLILKVSPDGEPEILQQREDLRFTISKRIIEIYSSRITVANGNGKAIPLVMNSHVRRAIKQFQGREKGFFIRSYKRSGKYRPAILRALRKAGLPEELSWLPLIESGFYVRAFSRARALGLWQFIASTGYKFGLKRDTWVDERMDPQKSTRAAIAYLKELHRIFGDWTTALAAYNCGEGTVLRSIRTQRINYLDNFWDLYEKLPRETASYVPRMMAVLHILNDPETYGFDLPAVDDEIRTDRVKIDKQLHLKTLAKHIGSSYKTLKSLNPELRHGSTPNRSYEINVPAGKGDLLLAKLEEIPDWRPPVPAYVTHRVRKGETLSTIAQRYHAGVRDIMRLNRLRSKHFIRAGWKLKIPTGKKWAATQTAAAAAKASGKPVKYVVRKGDSLWKIARRFGTTTKRIQSLNNLRTTRLQIGQLLKISKGSTKVSRAQTKPYRVMKGDSPYVIALRHHMKLSDFLRINQLTPRSTIYPGQTLLVRAR